MWFFCDKYNWRLGPILRGVLHALVINMVFAAYLMENTILVSSRGGAFASYS